LLPAHTEPARETAATIPETFSPPAFQNKNIQHAENIAVNVYVLELK